MPAEVFVPPFGALTPERHYFLFGQPIDLAGVSPDDEAACAAVYERVQGAVKGGILRLQRDVRANDPYRDLILRSAWEALYDAQAPGPTDLVPGAELAADAIAPTVMAENFHR